MIITKNYLQKLIKEETTRFFALQKIPVLHEGKKKQTLNHPTEILEVFAKKLAERGYDVSDAQELGSGFNGIVYSYADSTKVIKITIDDSEAQTANHLKGKKLKYVIPIYDVFRFDAKGSNNDWYGIIEAKAEETDDNTKNEFDKFVRIILDKLSLSIMQQLENSPWLMPWKEMKQRSMKNAFDQEEKTNLEEAFSFLESLKFDKLLEELKSNSVEYFDVHAKNFMNYQGRFVLVDLGGHSKSPGKIPDLLEKRKK